MEELKKFYGDEYPSAIVITGIRMTLRREERFSRYYSSDEQNRSSIVSRFEDGSASITASELQNEWVKWTENTQIDFCQACSWIHDQPDFPEMVRFIMQHGNARHWSAIALSVASCLSREEAFAMLSAALNNTEPGSTSNIIKAIAWTKHPEAETTLRSHLATLWAHSTLWRDDAFLNWVAYDTTNCIAYLLELGAPADDFTSQVRQLSEHACSSNREASRRSLSSHYFWLQG